MTVTAGQMIGRYRVIAPIGRGGMGGVWEVEDEAGARFALKTPMQDIDAGVNANKRLAREANTMRMLDHPNLVAAADAFVHDGLLCLVMEKVEGTTLSRAMAKGPIAPRRALVITKQSLAGLEHAHGYGVAHRDLKPDNVMLVSMLSQSGQGSWEQVKLLDFGLAKLVGDADQLLGGGKLTRTGTVAGTPMYMAPEQALGREIDFRADLYSLGVILFEMLAGRPPFESEEPVELMRMHVKKTPPRLDAVVPAGTPWCTPAVIGLVEGALIKDPAHRFASAGAMTMAVEHAFASIDHIG